MKGQVVRRLLSALIPLLLAISTARAETAAEFYRGNTIRFVVGSVAGGGFDRYARLLAPRLAAATGATVVVQNRPGGGGKTALNKLVRAEPDGLTIMIVNGVPAVLAQVTGAAAVQYDMRRLAYLARIVASPWVLLVGAKSPYRSVADLVAASRTGKVITFAGMARVDGPTDTASVACMALVLNCRMLIGFGGAREAALAVMRGDAEGLAVSDRGAMDYSSGDKLIPIAVLARERSANLPEVPTVFEATQLTPEQAFWIDFRARLAEIGRAIVATPGVPEARVSFLRDAFEHAAADPDLLTEAEAMGLPVEFASGQKIEGIVRQAFQELPDGRLEAVRHVLLEKYF